MTLVEIEDACLHEPESIKEAPDLLDDFTPRAEDSSHEVMIDNAIQVALPVSRLLHEAASQHLLLLLACLLQQAEN